MLQWLNSVQLLWRYYPECNTHALFQQLLKRMQKWPYFNYDGTVANGSIINVIGDSIQYKIETEISLGSPLLNENFDVVGIHVGSLDTAPESAEELQQIVKQ